MFATKGNTGIHFARDKHKNNQIVFLVRIFRKRDVWISSLLVLSFANDTVHEAAYVMKRNFRSVVAEKILIISSVHSIPWNAFRPSLVM